jgi:hypothetical protein
MFSSASSKTAGPQDSVTLAKRLKYVVHHIAGEHQVEGSIVKGGRVLRVTPGHLIRSSSIVMTSFIGPDVVSSRLLLVGLVAFSHLQYSQIRGRRPYLINVRKTLYVIGTNRQPDAALRLIFKIEGGHEGQHSHDWSRFVDD